MKTPSTLAVQHGLLTRTLSSLKRGCPYLLACGFFFLYLLPLIINGEDSHIVIHDNLDSEVVWRVVLARHADAGVDSRGNEVVPQVMNGIPRADMVSDLNIIMALYKIFPPFSAYLLNHIIIHITALVGMYLLLHRYLLTSPDQDEYSNLICLGIAFAYSILPFYTMYGLSIAGLPILLYSFLNIANEKAKVTDYLTIIVFPLYSFLFLNGIFLIAGLFLIAMFFLIVKKRLAVKALFSWLIFVFLYLLIEHDFLQALIFNTNGPAQRSEWNLAYLSSPFQGVIRDILSMFLHGQYHAASHQELILITSIFAIITSVIYGKKPSLLVKLLLFEILIALIYGFSSWDQLIPIKNKLGLLTTFNWGRIHWLSPMIWYCIFCLSLVKLSRVLKLSVRARFYLAIPLIIIQLGINLVHNPEFGSLINHYLTIPGMAVEDITYRQYFSVNLFQEINDAVALPQAKYRVASIGLDPGIAQYNGFYTLDSYQNYYPLEYKHQFRKIIAPELAKDITWQEYFDFWGSRCYIFSSEVPDFLSTKNKNRAIQHLEIDIRAFAKMGGRFIFSAAEILNYKEEHLHLIGVFDEKDSAWRIYVYQVADMEGILPP